MGPLTRLDLADLRPGARAVSGARAAVPAADFQPSPAASQPPAGARAGAVSRWASFAGLAVAACLAGGCGSAPVVETHQAGEESKLLPGIYFLTDAQVQALRAAGLPDGAILERDMVRAPWGDDVVTIVLENISEAQGKQLKDDREALLPLLDRKEEAFTARSHYEGGKFYLSIGPIQGVKGVKSRLRFGNVTNVDEANHVLFAKYRPTTRTKKEAPPREPRPVRPDSESRQEPDSESPREPDRESRREEE
jgi:hypothetical protein